jgi:hypothetical protein
MRRALAAIALFVASAACDSAKPLGDDQRAYIGKWRSTSGTTTIQIYADGTADLKGPSRDIEKGTVSISKDSLQIKNGVTGQTFPITRAPLQEPTTGKWTMMLDADTYTRN